MVQTLTTEESEALIRSSPVDRSVVIDYSIDAQRITRQASARSFSSQSWMPIAESPKLVDQGFDHEELARLWNVLHLNGFRPHFYQDPARPRINIVDLFCGCGGLSVGVKNAADAVGARPVFLLAADVSAAALSVYKKNLRPLRSTRQNVETLIDYVLWTDAKQSEVRVESVHLSHDLAALGGAVDILIAGPPCEGNSNFNNRTRRFDHRNNLYLDAVIAGIALNAKVIVIENVPMVKRSHQDVVINSLQLLRESGYRIRRNEFTLTASDFGTPQDRQRHFLIAAMSDRTPAESDFDALKVQAPTVLEAIDPLLQVERRTTFDSPSQLSSDNQKRVKFLIQNDQYDLPDDKRPDCHRLRKHTYPSVYGRLRPNEPAPTITTGFLSPGRGRYTHPLEARSLTPHEGARLQGFGEDFDWLVDSPEITRSDYANMIGAAVPPQLGFAVGMCALSLL